MECRHHYRKHLQYPGQSGDTIQPRHGPLMAYRPDFITDVPGGLLALRSTSPCDAKLRGLVDDLNPVDGGFPYSRTHYEPRPFGREMEKGMLVRFTIGVQSTLQLEQVGQTRRRTAFSSWKSRSIVCFSSSSDELKHTLYICQSIGLPKPLLLAKLRSCGMWKRTASGFPPNPCSSLTTSFCLFRIDPIVSTLITLLFTLYVHPSFLKWKEKYKRSKLQNIQVCTW